MRWFRRKRRQSQTQTQVRPTPKNRVPLEVQLERLAELGLRLNPGVTVDDLLLSWTREDYESRPYDLVLFAMGSEVEREPWGRPVCDHAWTFDLECIEGDGCYVRIARNLCRVAGMPDLLGELRDSVDFDARTAWLEYMVDGQRRRWEMPCRDDWADPETIEALMADIARDGFRFYAMPDGQASIWFYLDPDAAAALNRLTDNALR